MMLYLSYLNKVLRHKWFVCLECYKAGIFTRGIFHDFSKLLPDEFVPYARYWEKTPEDRMALEIIAYANAKRKHEKRNRHHWEWWLKANGNGEQLPMDEKSRLEMLCDWRGAGRAYNGVDDSLEYFLKNRDNIVLHPDTKAWIENELLKEVCPYEQNSQA